MVFSTSLCTKTLPAFGPDLSRREPPDPKTLWIASFWLPGTQLRTEQWLAEAERSLGCSCQCDRRLQGFVKQIAEPSQIEAPSAAQLCNWDGNGPMRGSSLCLTFWESCSRRLKVAGCWGGDITNNKPLHLICNELVINRPGAARKSADYRAASAESTGPPSYFDRL